MISNMVNWSPGMTLDDLERLVIQAAYRHYQGNKTVTAGALGIAIRTLDSKLEKYAEHDKQTKEREDNVRRERESFLARARGRYTPAHTVHVPSSDIPAALPNEPRLRSNSGVRMESVTNATAQSTVPVSERKEVQGVLSRQAPGRGAKGTGEKLSGTNVEAGHSVSNERERRKD